MIVTTNAPILPPKAPFAPKPGQVFLRFNYYLIIDDEYVLDLGKNSPNYLRLRKMSEATDDIQEQYLIPVGTEITFIAR